MTATYEIFYQYFEHPQGKQYLAAIIRDKNNPQAGPCWVIRNWGKQVFTDFSIGQVQIMEHPDYWTGTNDYGKELQKRASRGYLEIAKQSWVNLTTGQDAMLRQHGWAPGFATNSNVGKATIQHNADGTTTHTYTDGSSATFDANGNNVPLPQVRTPKKVVDPDAVPGPRTGGAKRLEWVMAHADHPQALDQMMQVAQQMTTERDKAATTVANIDNDLAFVNAWLSQQLATLVKRDS